MKMKLLILLWCVAAFAAPGKKFGLGVTAGEPFGLSLKKFLGNDHAIEAAFALGSGHDHRWHEDWKFYMNASYQWHNFEAIEMPSGSMPLFWGLGGRMWGGDLWTLGLRGHGGMGWMPAGAPIDLCLEVGLVVDFIGHSGPDLDGGLLFRFYF